MILLGFSGPEMNPVGLIYGLTNKYDKLTKKFLNLSPGLITSLPGR